MINQKILKKDFCFFSPSRQFHRLKASPAHITAEMNPAVLTVTSHKILWGGFPTRFKKPVFEGTISVEPGDGHKNMYILP
jgi:hypothetical protein